MTKRTVSKPDKHTIRAEYLLDKDRKLKMVNIYDFESDWLDIANICLNIPTPFKKGDLLISNSKVPFGEGHVLNYDKFPFVLVHLLNWSENFQKLIKKGNYDCSDMEGVGYLLSEAGELYCDNIFDYDSWEYCSKEEELQGAERILKGVSSLMQDEIGIDTFLDVYEYIKKDEKQALSIYTTEGLKLAGLTNKDIKKLGREK